MEFPQWAIEWEATLRLVFFCIGMGVAALCVVGLILWGLARLFVLYIWPPEE